MVKEHTVDQQTMLLIKYKNKQNANGLKTWKPLEFSNKMNFGNLAKWVKPNKNKF